MSKIKFVVSWLDASTVKMHEGSEDPDPDSGTEREKQFVIMKDAVKFAIGLDETRADYWGCPRISRQELRIHTDYDGSRYSRWEELDSLNVCDFDDLKTRNFTLDDFENHSY